jgi:hypothetical protein
MDVTRRKLLMAAGAILGLPLIVETVWPQHATTGFKVTMTTLFWVGEISNREKRFHSKQ